MIGAIIMKKRLISWITTLAVIVMQLMSPFSLIAYADEILSASVTIGSVSGKPGDVVSVPLKLSENSGLNGLMVKLEYNSNALECMRVVDEGLFGSDSFDLSDITTDNPFRMGWTNTVLVINTGTLVTIDFKIKDSASNGDYELKLETDSSENFQTDNTKDFLDPDFFISVDINLTSGKITVIDKTPTAPVISNTTTSSFDVEIPQENEYTYSTSEITDFSDCTWYTDRTVSNLLPNTKYYVYQRVAETNTTKASPVSAAAEVTTKKYDINDVIESVSIGNNGVFGTILTPAINYKNGFNKDFLGEITYLWSTAEGTDESISMAETYTITSDDVSGKRELYVTIAASNCKGIIKSNNVTAGKRNYDEKIDGPILSATVTKTADGFTIGAMDGYEYVISETTTVPTSAAWADLGNNVTVTDKVLGSTWYVFTRVKETDTVNASEPSVPVSVKIPSDNSKLTDLSLTNGTLNPSFNADITDYTVIIPYGINVPNVAAVKQDSGAEITIKQATDFNSDNQAVITVTAENGTSQTVYTVTFIESSVLSSLSVNNTIINDFSSTKLNYTYFVSYADWLADRNKVYTISALSNNSANVNISENNFTLNSDNYDAAEVKDITITVNSNNGEQTIYTVKFVVEACPHANRIENTSKEATCTELGEKETVCSVCGKRFGIENIPALGHDFDNGTTIYEPGCVNMGTVKYQCSRCDESFTRTIPAFGHRWGEVTVDTVATCTTDGISSRHCEACGAHGYETLIPALGHNFGAWTKIDDTIYERACSVCNTKETKIVTDPTHEHIFNGMVDIITPATCQAFGSQNVHCSVEGCTEFVTEETAKIAHIPNESIVINATCTTAGNSVAYCAICNTKLSETELPATGHSFTNYTDTATCTLPGIRTAVCDYGCGTSDSIPTPAKGHSYGDWQKNETGHWHECSVCHNTTEVISHTENGGVITTPATATTDGIKTFSCTECGYVIRTETFRLILDHTVHTFGTRWDYDSTYHWYECTVCGEHSNTALHTEDNGVITVQPTAMTSGTRTYYCSVCGYAMRTETIPPIDNPDPPYPVNPIPSYPTITYPTSAGTQTANEPYIYGDTSKTGWDAIASEITFAADGSTVRVNMNGTTELPQAVVSYIQNRNINLELNMGSTIWTINGLDVTNPKTVNMRVAERLNKIPDSVMESLYSELTAKQLQLYHSGNFGFTAKLALNVGKKYNGYYATLYYYNTKTKQLEYNGQSCVSGGIAEFEFTHASYYAIGFSSEPIFDDISSGAGVVDFGTLVDVDSPVTNGVCIPQAVIPRGFKLSNKKRRYRILKKRRLDDLVFVL